MVVKSNEVLVVQREELAPCVVERAPAVRQDLVRIAGEVAFILSGSELHNRQPILNLHERFIRPIRLGQGRMFRTEQGAPVGVVTWACLSEALHNRMLTEGPQQLLPDDWQSGPHLWVVEFAVLSSRVQPMVRAIVDILETEYPDAPSAHLHRISEDGQNWRLGRWDNRRSAARRAINAALAEKMHAAV